MASTPTPDVKEHRWSTRERPWLVPWNRKLRHLRGITLRNLDLSENEKTKPQTFDDDALPNSLKTPAKLLAMREGRTLEHSRSSSDLRPIHESALSDSESSVSVLGGSPKSVKKSPKSRPSLAKMRRRSTMEWASGSPHQRQKRLEDVSATRTADVFFTIHILGIDEAIYVSEVAEKTMDPDFRHIDLDGCGPGITRIDSLTVKFWVKSDKMSIYTVLLDLSLSLRSLQFIGRDLAAFTHPYPHNCVIFQLSDGYYTCFTDAQVDEPVNPFSAQTTKSATGRPLPTASFDALLRLSKLDDSIQDALVLQQRLSKDLERIAEQNRLSVEEKSHLAETKDFIKTVEYAKATVEKQLRNAQKTKEQKLAGLKERREILNKGRAEREQGLDEILAGQFQIEEDRTRQDHLRISLTQQRRRICEDIQKVYPITPLPDKSLSFTIRGLSLPDSEQLDNMQPDPLAGALGHVAHVVSLLSFYLSQPLPYPIHPRSSSSTISDPISIMKLPATDAARIFPLFPRSGPRFRFEYALFLLNKDIEILLANAFRVRVLDIRQTLPNLLYALYCATAGEEELPSRKAGGVRGLLRVGKGGGASMPSPRSESVDSHTKEDGSAQGSLIRNQEEQERKMRGK